MSSQPSGTPAQSGLTQTGTSAVEARGLKAGPAAIAQRVGMSSFYSDPMSSHGDTVEAELAGSP
jgi:hypothetical protein